MMNTEGCEKPVDTRYWVPLLVEACKNKDPLQHSSNYNQSDKFFPSFCITCLQLFCKFCPKGTNRPHDHHTVLPVYKGSRDNCLHESQVSKFIDISDIDLYTINHKQVVFINRRHCEQPKSRTNKSGSACNICGRELIRETKFCSVQCKIESGKDLELKLKRKAEEGEEPAALKPQSYRKRSRKGVPTRSILISPLTPPFH